jgi:RDD family
MRSAREEPASFTRRLLGDELLEVTLFFMTLIVGWFVWLALVAQRGRTPAKDFVGVVIHDYRTGEVASWKQVWIREAGGKLVFPATFAAFLSVFVGSNFGSAFFGVYHVLGLLSGLVLEERRAVWDHIAGTFVLYHPEPKRR